MRPCLVVYGGRMPSRGKVSAVGKMLRTDLSRVRRTRERGEQLLATIAPASRRAREAGLGASATYDPILGVQTEFSRRRVR